jgi:hypothetical protein
MILRYGARLRWNLDVLFEEHFQGYLPQLCFQFWSPIEGWDSRLFHVPLAIQHGTPIQLGFDPQPPGL